MQCLFSCSPSTPGEKLVSLSTQSRTSSFIMSQISLTLQANHNSYDVTLIGPLNHDPILDFQYAPSRSQWSGCDCGPKINANEDKHGDTGICYRVFNWDRIMKL